MFPDVIGFVKSTKAVHYCVFLENQIESNLFDWSKVCSHRILSSLHICWLSICNVNGTCRVTVSGMRVQLLGIVLSIALCLAVREQQEQRLLRQQEEDDVENTPAEKIDHERLDDE